MVITSIMMLLKSSFEMHREKSDQVSINADQSEALSQLEQSQRSESSNLELESNHSSLAVKDVQQIRKQ